MDDDQLTKQDAPPAALLQPAAPPSRQSRIKSALRAHPYRWGSAGIAVSLLLLLTWLIFVTPSIADLHRARASQGSELRYADGKLMETFRQIQQDRVTLEKISPHVINALIATEDRRFYQHHGIDVTRTASAVVHTLTGRPQGGSTITQQLARNMFPEEIGRSRSVTRKLKEAVTALKIERTYTKKEILETYLNTVPFLYNVYGIELAARTYFDKPASDLNVQEAATLVGMLKGTNYYNPVVNPERAVQRRNVVLQQMVKAQHLSDAKYKELEKKPLRVKFNRQYEKQGAPSHFAGQVRRWLADWADEHNYNLYEDGLIITTTLDSALQEAAAKAVERQGNLLQNVADWEWSQRSPGAAPQGLGSGKNQRANAFQHYWNSRPDVVEAFIRESAEFKKAVESGSTPAAALANLKQDKDFMGKLRAAKTRLEAGFVAIDPASGEIRAWIGSRDFQRDQFDHVAQAERQPGSTFKPFVYGAALESGIEPDRVYPDTDIEIRSADGSVWRPTDMSGPSGRMMSLREGLIQSKNTITAQVARDVGLPNIIRMAHSLGVDQDKLEPVPSLALGVSPVTLLEMVNAYAAIAQQGVYRTPIFVKRITDRHGNVLAEFSSPSRRAMSPATADTLTDIMRGVVDQGTGQAIRTRFGIRADVAGKTGTTQNNTDGWFILMHPNLVAGAWVGFNDTRVTMRSDYWGQGGHNAILLVGDFFQQALRARKVDARVRFSAPHVEPLPVDPYPAPPPEGPYSNPVSNIFEQLGRTLRRMGDAPDSSPRPRPRPSEAPKFSD